MGPEGGEDLRFPGGEGNESLTTARVRKGTHSDPVDASNLTSSLGRKGKAKAIKSTKTNGTASVTDSITASTSRFAAATSIPSTPVIPATGK